jgi:hypothetical protein
MEKLEIALIASKFILYFALDKEVRERSYVALRDTKNTDTTLAALINDTVKDSVKVTAADMPAIRTAIQLQLNALPAALKVFGGPGILEWFDQI